MYRMSEESAITVDVPNKTLSLYQGNRLITSYPIAIGKSSTPTPLGQWEVINRKILSDNGVFGSRWIGLSAYGYGIHGTNNPHSIGTAASLGCIRLSNENVEELFNRVTIGTPVTITAHINSHLNQSTSGHIIQPGDTLWQIATTYHLPLEKLMALNPATNPQALRVGERIRLN